MKQMLAVCDHVLWPDSALYCRMGKVFKFLGMSVAVVTDDVLHPRRRELFKADVLYITAMQLTFTYLHDNTAKAEYLVVSAIHGHSAQQDMKSDVSDTSCNQHPLTCVTTKPGLVVSCCGQPS